MKYFPTTRLVFVFAQFNIFDQSPDQYGTHIGLTEFDNTFHFFDVVIPVQGSIGQRFGCHFFKELL